MRNVTRFAKYGSSPLPPIKCFLVEVAVIFLFCRSRLHHSRNRQRFYCSLAGGEAGRRRQQGLDVEGMRERMSYPWDVLFYSMFGHRSYQPLAGDSTGFSGSGRTISLAYGTKRKGFMFTGSPCGISRNRKTTKTEGKKIKGCAREQPSPYN